MVDQTDAVSTTVVDASAPPSDWRPISDMPIGGDKSLYVDVRSVTTYRWKPYKADGRRQMGAAGRWQMALGEYGGWVNASPPKGAEFRLNASDLKDRP